MRWVAVGLWACAAGCAAPPDTLRGGQPRARRGLSVPLPAYPVEPGAVAVAGISAGGFLAVQLHVAYSATFQRGAAVFAGGPYDCAEGGALAAVTTCAQGLPQAPDVAALIQRTDARAASGDIDPTAHLAGEPVWLWSGTLDTTVRPAVMDALFAYYQHYVTAAAVTYEHTTAAGHGWVSPSGPNLCAATVTPFVNDCPPADPEAAFLGQSFGPLSPRNSGALAGSFQAFDQNEFFDDQDAPAHGLADDGYLYVPSSCVGGQVCRVLLALHGCLQARGQVGDAFLQTSGLAEWADGNRLLLLFPQGAPSAGNPNACWDWWGYDDPSYATKAGRQMLALKRMVDRVSSGATDAGQDGGAATADGGSADGGIADAGPAGDAGAADDGGSPVDSGSSGLDESDAGLGSGGPVPGCGCGLTSEGLPWATFLSALPVIARVRRHRAPEARLRRGSH